MIADLLDGHFVYIQTPPRQLQGFFVRCISATLSAALWIVPIVGTARQFAFRFLQSLAGILRPQTEQTQKPLSFAKTQSGIGHRRNLEFGIFAYADFVRASIRIKPLQSGR